MDDKLPVNASGTNVTGEIIEDSYIECYIITKE